MEAVPSVASPRGLDSDFAVLRDDTVPRIAASAPAGRNPSEAITEWGEGGGSDRLIGMLVHRLLQREGLGTSASDDRLRQTAMAMLSTVPSPETEDPSATIEQALARFRALSAQQDLRDLYLSGAAFHEVPFTMAVDGRILRGTIDCVVAVAADRVTVLEFKTGRPRAEHQAQADVYRMAAQALFPGATVDTRLVYTGDSGVS